MLDNVALQRILFGCPASAPAMASVCFCARESQGSVWIWASEHDVIRQLDPLEPLPFAGFLRALIPCGDQLPRCRLNVRWHRRRALERTRWRALSSFRYISGYKGPRTVSKRREMCAPTAESPQPFALVIQSPKVWADGHLV